MPPPPAPSPPPKGPWAGKTLHVWTTACDLGNREVGDIVGLVSKHPMVLGGVGVACTSITRDGTLLTFEEQPVGLGRAQVARRMRKLGLSPTFVVSNYGPNGFDGALAMSVLANKKKRTALAEAIVHAATSEGFAGVELDLELMPNAAAPHYAELAREVHDRLEGKLALAVDVHPKTKDDPGWLGPGGHDYAALAATGAVLRLMTYDLSIGPVPAGPSTKASWIREVVEYARSKNVPSEQLEIGLPAYGYDFPPQGKGQAAPLRFEEVAALRAKTKAELARDENDVPHFAYDGVGGRHEVWFDDEKSLARLLGEIGDLAKEVRGVAVWGMGRADPNLGKCLAEQGFAVANKTPG